MNIEELYDCDFEEIEEIVQKNWHLSQPHNFAKVLAIRPDIYSWCVFTSKDGYLKDVLKHDPLLLKTIIPYVPINQLNASNLIDAIHYDNIEKLPHGAPCFNDADFNMKALSLDFAPNNKAFYQKNIMDEDTAQRAISCARYPKYIPLSQRQRNYQRHQEKDEGEIRNMFYNLQEPIRLMPKVLYAMCSRLASLLQPQDEYWLQHALQNEACVKCLIQNGVSVAHKAILICPDTEHTLILGALARADKFNPDFLTDEFNEDKMAKVYAILDSQGFTYKHEYHTHPQYLLNYHTDKNNTEEIDILF